MQGGEDYVGENGRCRGERAVKGEKERCRGERTVQGEGKVIASWGERTVLKGSPGGEALLLFVAGVDVGVCFVV